MLPIVREQLRQATGSPVTEGHSMDTVLSLSTRRRQFNMLLMSVFGCSAVLLAAVGIYGLMSYTVEQRTAEIAIRVALGESNRIRAMVIRQGMSLAMAGLAVGIAQPPDCRASSKASCSASTRATPWYSPLFHSCWPLLLSSRFGSLHTAPARSIPFPPCAPNNKLFSTWWRL